MWGLTLQRRLTTELGTNWYPVDKDFRGVISWCLVIGEWAAKSVLWKMLERLPEKHGALRLHIKEKLLTWDVVTQSVTKSLREGTESRLGALALRVLIFTAAGKHLAAKRALEQNLSQRREMIGLPTTCKFLMNCLSDNLLLLTQVRRQQWPFH